MLAFFQTEKIYNGLAARLYVDCKRKEAQLSLSYQGRLLRVETIPNTYGNDVFTPDKAEAWLGRSAGERGNMVEHWEWQARTGILVPAPAMAES